MTDGMPPIDLGAIMAMARSSRPATWAAAPVIVTIAVTIAPALKTMLAELERLASPKITMRSEDHEG